MTASKTQFRARAIGWVLRILSWMPLRAAHAAGAAFGWLAWILHSRRRRVAAANLTHCLPELDVIERERLLRRNLVETGKSMFELGALWNWPPERVLDLVIETDGLDDLRGAMREGRGVIVVAPHFGSWEAAGLVLAREFPITILYAPGRLGIDALMRDARSRAGAEIVEAGVRGVAKLARSLRAGGMVGILPDQDPGADSGVFAPFFGVQAKTMTLVSRLASSTSARPFLVWTERLPRGGGYGFHAHEAPAEIASAPLERSVAAMNAAIERIVRANPEQYLWSYKRFRTRPAGEGRFYKR